MSNLQIVLLSLCNDVSRGCSVPGGPVFALDREPHSRAIVRWLRWNDGNGDYPRDCDSQDDAWEWLRMVMIDDLYPWNGCWS